MNLADIRQHALNSVQDAIKVSKMQDPPAGTFQKFSVKLSEVSGR